MCSDSQDRLEAFVKLSLHCLSSTDWISWDLVEDIILGKGVPNLSFSKSCLFLGLINLDNCS